MEDKFDTMLSEDHDDDGELDVEVFPIPKGLERAWDALHANEALEKGLNATIATAYAHAGDKSPGPGLGANYAVDTPNKKKPKRVQKRKEEDPTGVKQALKTPKEPAQQTVKTDKETYTGFRGVEKQHKYVLPNPKASGQKYDHKANREHLDKEVKRNQKPGNFVDIKRGKDD